MNIQLSEHFTYKKLLRFILPSIIMMVFTSIYSVVDGIFVPPRPTSRRLGIWRRVRSSRSVRA